MMTIVNVLVGLGFVGAIIGSYIISHFIFLSEITPCAE